MAIYHFSGTVISRSSGRSVVAAAAYRAGEKLYDERQGLEIDYSRKQGVVYKEILLPEGASVWMADRGQLWNEVEEVEKRKDAQLAREFNFALPRELSQKQRIELAKEFVQQEFVNKGMIADLCIHESQTKEGEEQPHAHVLLTLRRSTQKGFGLKERSWNAKENLLAWREAWAEYANRYLALNGIEQRIDHRTLAEQGIALEAQKKIGPELPRIWELRMAEHQRIARENGEKIFEEPAIALKAMTQHQSTFTQQELARLINRYTADGEQFQRVYEKVQAAEQMITLTDELGNQRFTTQEMLSLEQRMLEDAIELRNNAFIATRSHDLELTGTILSPQQQEALKYILGAGDLKCLVGYAGTGKSRLLNQAREMWEKDGYRVQGITLAGIAAENLEAASGIKSRTLASKDYYWNRGEEKLTNKDVVVVDEAGMLGSRPVARVLAEAREGQAKVVLIGDPQQLQAIEAGGAFRAISEQVGYLELTEVRRQQELWQQEATKELAEQQIESALDRYDRQGWCHEFATQAEAKTYLVEHWDLGRRQQPEKTQIMLAHTRKDVKELNRMAREWRKVGKELSQEQELPTAMGKLEFASGDKIYFLQNNRELGVKNGTLGTIEKIEGSQVTVKLDKEEPEQTRTVRFDVRQYNQIAHGYAATIHKAQGVTVDRSYVLASKGLDRHAIYVAMSRHREKAELFWGKDEFLNKAELKQRLSRDRSKDVTLDYFNRNIERAEQSEITKWITQANSIDELQEEFTKLCREGESMLGKYLAEFSGLEQKGVGAKGQNVLETVLEQQEKQTIQVFQKQFEQEHMRLAAKVREEFTAITTPQRREVAGEQKQVAKAMEPTKAIKLVEKYYAIEKRLDRAEEIGNKHERGVANIEKHRCVKEICKDEAAMQHLQKNDGRLFKEMETMREQERARELEKGWEREL